MKKLFSIFAIIAIIGITACKQEETVSKEAFDNLSNQLVEKETEIATLQDELKALELLEQELALCSHEKDSLLALTAKKKTTVKKPTAPTTPTTVKTEEKPQTGKAQLKEGETQTKQEGGKARLKQQ